MSRSKRARATSALLAVTAALSVGGLRLAARPELPSSAMLTAPAPAAPLSVESAAPAPSRGACASWGEAVPGRVSSEATLCFGIGAVVRDGVPVELPAAGEIVVWLERVTCTSDGEACRTSFDVSAAPPTSVSIDPALDRALIDATLSGRCRVAAKIVGLTAAPAERAEVFRLRSGSGATIRVTAPGGAPSVRAAEPSGEAAVCGERFDAGTARGASIFESAGTAVEGHVTSAPS